MDRAIEKKTWTPKRIASIIAIAAFLFFIFYLLFLRDKSSKLYVDKNTLTIAPVLADKFLEFIPIDGVVFPKNTNYIDVAEGGVVEQKFVEDGAMLEEGDTIVKLMNSQMELSNMEQETRMLAEINNLSNTKLALEQNNFYRQKEIVTLEYTIDKTKIDFERKQGLFNEKVISPKEFEDAEREYNFTMKQLSISLELQRLDSISGANQTRSINTSLNRMQQNIQLLRKNMENAFIKAPASGKLSSFNVEIGETKRPGDRLGQIDMQDGFKLRANIDERYISRVYEGQGAEFDFNGVNYPLEIFKIYTDVTNGSFQVDMHFVNGYPESIKRGQTIQLRLKFSGETDAIIIKRGSFFQETGGNWIYVVDPTGSFAIKRSIRLNRQNTNYYEVMEGLQPGENVIVSSYDSFGSKDKLIFR
ncbi:MAG: efflux transporter periplasmic adaptor subunit [Bacteroidetes bacterium HGW-Bacteroidetes-17]|jgi:HlyD family secretion protein|nr:MAG: efflux transporter periplasmic adaptor subunit [Bacteroidetes bacterium HGW-Bacteroidetes-17]